MMDERRVYPRHCPWCSYKVDAVTGVSGSPEAPEEGDLMLCLSCGEWGIEAGDGTIRRPDGEELNEIGLNPDCRRARRAWASVMEKRKT